MVLGRRRGRVDPRACGKSASGPATLFQWQDYTAPAFYADYEKAYGEKPATTHFRR